MSGLHTITVADVLMGADFRPAGPTAITIADGLIQALEPTGAAPGPRRLAVPGIANAHDHGRPLSTTSFGAGNKPLETWLPSLATMPSVDPYLAHAAPFGRALRGGAIGAMVHLTRPMGLTPFPEEARIIARAASDVGLRIALAISVKDRNPLVYGDHTDLLAGLSPSASQVLQETFLKPPLPFREQLDVVDAVAADITGPMVDVQYGPNGVQWCSDAMLEEIARRSADTGRRIHMHLLETPYQRAYADREYPQGIVRHLADIGLLSPRLTLAHCVWASPDELELIAEHGARIAVNTSSNLHLMSGIAPVEEMLRRGVAVAMGLDGCAFDEDDDALRELRLFKILHSGWGFPEEMSRVAALKAACSTGRAAIGAPGSGLIEIGAPADFLLLDLDALDRDAIMPVDPCDYLFARAHAGHITASFVAGREVLTHGRLNGIDLDAVESELRAAYRSAMPGRAPFLQAWKETEPAIARFYQDRLGCF